MTALPRTTDGHSGLFALHSVISFNSLAIIDTEGKIKKKTFKIG